MIEPGYMPARFALSLHATNCLPNVVNWTPMNTCKTAHHPLDQPRVFLLRYERSCNWIQVTKWPSDPSPPAVFIRSPFDREPWRARCVWGGGDEVKRFSSFHFWLNVLPNIKYIRVFIPAFEASNKKPSIYGVLRGNYSKNINKTIVSLWTIIKLFWRYYCFSFNKLSSCLCCLMFLVFQ